MRAMPLVIATSVALGALISWRRLLDGRQLRAQQASRKVDMGDYEPVVPWPKPLPDTDLSHDGWTWGSGAGVWAESPDKVWVMQRGEISLPPGAEPWICACLLNPRRTNTGRRDYSGNAVPLSDAAAPPGLRRGRHRQARSRSGCSTTTTSRRRAAPGSAKWAADRTRS